MLFLLAVIVIGSWVLWSGWKFYRTIDWNEAPEPSPDLKAMHKKEAEFLHIQDVIETACAEGKLSKGVGDEFRRYSEAEIQAMKNEESAWKNRKK